MRPPDDGSTWVRLDAETPHEQIEAIVEGYVSEAIEQFHALVADNPAFFAGCDLVKHERQVADLVRRHNWHQLLKGIGRCIH